MFNIIFNCPCQVDQRSEPSLVKIVQKYMLNYWLTVYGPNLASNMKYLLLQSIRFTTDQMKIFAQRRFKLKFK